MHVMQYQTELPAAGSSATGGGVSTNRSRLLPSSSPIATVPEPKFLRKAASGTVGQELNGTILL